MLEMKLDSVLESYDYDIQKACKVEISYANGNVVTCKLSKGHMAKVECIINGDYASFDEVEFISKDNNMVKFKKDSKYFYIDVYELVYIYNLSHERYNTVDKNGVTINPDDTEDPSDVSNSTKVEKFKTNFLPGEWVKAADFENIWTLDKSIDKFSNITGIYNKNNEKMLVFINQYDNLLTMYSDEPFEGYVHGYKVME